MKVEVDVLGLCGRQATLKERGQHKSQEMCGSQVGRPGLPVSNNPYGLCGRKATLNERTTQISGDV